MILSNDKVNPAIHLDKKSNVETPLLDQLASLGWTVIRLQQIQTPEQSHRSSFDTGNALSYAGAVAASYQPLSDR